MTFSAPRPVVSGKPYRVRRVLGHDPHDLSDFAGQTAFDLDVGPEAEEYSVMGAGLSTGDGVQVFEKDDEGYGKDVRVWTVRHDPSTSLFSAEHCGPWPGHV